MTSDQWGHFRVRSARVTRHWNKGPLRYPVARLSGCVRGRPSISDNCSKATTREPGVGEPKDQAINKVPDQPGEHRRRSSGIPVDTDTHAHHCRHEGQGSEKPPDDSVGGAITEPGCCSVDESLEQQREGATDKGTDYEVNEEPSGGRG